MGQIKEPMKYIKNKKNRKIIRNFIEKFLSNEENDDLKKPYGSILIK